MMEWKKVNIADIAFLKNGKKRPSAKGHIPAYGGNGIMDYVDSFNDENNVIIGRVGAYCGCVYLSKGKCWVSDNAISAKAKDGNDNEFLFYLLLNQNLNHHHIGGAQPLMTQDVIGRIQANVPKNISDQKRIASILSSLDRKIETNNKINARLEEMAQAIFKDWFVDFTPFKNGKFVDSELGMIPEGWRVGVIGELINTTSGGTPSRKKEDFYQNGDVCWVKSKELLGGYILDTEEKITEEAVCKSSAKMIPINSVLIAMYGATVGEYGIISQEMTCNQAVCALIPNNKVPFTYLFMIAKNKKEELINSAIGSAQQNISQVIIKALKVVYDEKTVLSFNEKVKPLFEKIKLNAKENQRLASLRDTLLPKLMSGEIEV